MHEYFERIKSLFPAHAKPAEPAASSAGASPVAWAGLDRSQPVFHVTYAKTEQLVERLAAEVAAATQGDPPDAPPLAVVGLARAGIVPATMLAQHLGCELHLLQCQRHRSGLHWMGLGPEAGARLLLVDDFASSGQTLACAALGLRASGHQVRSLALYYDSERCQHRPDHGLPAPGFIRFAWERRETTPGSRALLAEKGALPPAQMVACFGVDMDGILLPDLPRDHYRRDLAATLARRHQLLPLPPHRLPDIDWSLAHIVTGRPRQDWGPTRAWLDKHGYAGCPLHMRDSVRHEDSAAGAAAHKAEALTRIGASVFIESELMQALDLAHRCPTVDVVWWGAHRRLHLGAVYAPSFGARD